MSKDTPFSAMIPPNTTLTSRTASRGSCPRASCACVISCRPNEQLGENDPANGVAGHNDEGYLIPSTIRATFPPAFNFLLSSFLIEASRPGTPRCSLPSPRGEVQYRCAADLP